MDEETEANQRQYESSRPFTSAEVQEEANNDQPQRHRRPFRQFRSILSYRMRSYRSRDDAWSCLFLLVTFWCFASMTLIMGLYGSSNVHLGPNCSRLIRTNALFVQSIKVKELDESKPGLVLYGFYEPPPMDVETTCTETHNTSVLKNTHKEWIYFLNKGSRVDIMFNVKSPSSLPLLLAIAKGGESLAEWIDNPSYPNTTLSWNIINGRGKVQLDITTSSSYFIAVGNLNSEEIEVELKFTIKSFLYNTTQAYYKCLLAHGQCSLSLALLGEKIAVLTSPPRNKDSPADGNRLVNLSYGPQWFTYFIGSCLLTAAMFVAFKYCYRFQNELEFRSSEVVRPERAPLLLPKDEDEDDDTSSWADDFVSNDEYESFLQNEAKNDDTHLRLCVICFDSQRDCFFLPSGHCVTCITCGTRIAEEGGSCPICSRKMKKVRKIIRV